MEIDDRAEEVLRYRAKAALRQRARALRSTVPASALQERSLRIVANLRDVPAVRDAESLALFWPIEAKNEVDLRALDARLRTRNKRLFYPAIDPDSREMTFRLVGDLVELEERGFGFAEPPPQAVPAQRLDVVVVPALQLDPRGHRIGYGAGYYDRTLPRFAPPATTIGVGFDFQLVPEVPVTEGDVALDLVVTDVRVLDARDRR